MKSLPSLRRITALITLTLAPMALCLPVQAAASNNPAPAAPAANQSAPGALKPEVDRRLFGSGAPPSLVRKHHFRGLVAPHVPHRRGLAVIADFSDAQLENWQGAGIHSVSELSSQLRKMEEHWRWLSHKQEKFQWDIIRVTLPVTLRPDAYADWGAYRNAVGALIRQQVDVSRYDANHDGVIDTAWVIASDQGLNYDYLIGGASSNAGVNIFVDSQNSLSLDMGATGNFNHEVAHTIGVPDLYGPYDTLHYLTLMSDSWALPPQDFTAYERTLLGWARPRLLDRGSQNVHLSPSVHRMDAVRIDTARPSEYFLIEYRRRPDSGFGATAPPYDGLAVYHVLEGSNQWTDPPLLKLEAADGAIAPNAWPEPGDFLFLDNLAMNRPLVLRSYFGGNEVFRIDNLYKAGNAGLGFNVQVAPQVKPGNLLRNASFEQGQNALPDAWTTSAWAQTAVFSWDARVARQGQRSVRIASPSPNDASWTQTATGLVPGQAYQFCGWVRGENIATGPDAQVGANVSVIGGFVQSESLSGTFDWTQACVVFRPDTTSATLACRMGFYGSTVTGKLWCDDMTLEPLKSAFN
ncbi:MAG: hypothetical protein Q7U14_00540 [Lacisediminimonas sp.]|nr:hypothetical protein [Lacisediminimonas sp.]